MNLRATLVVSGVANIALLALAVYLLQQRLPPSPPVAAGTNATSQPPLPPPVPSPRPAGPGRPPDTPRFDWRSLESSDYRTYMANLRAVGCPEETIRDIIIVDITKFYATKRAQLSANTPFKYWATSEQGELSGGEVKARHTQERALQAEMRAVIQDLLGVDYEQAQPGYLAHEDETARKLAFLSEAKRAQVAAIRNQFPGLDEGIRRVAGGNPPRDAADIFQQYQRQKTLLMQTLTPAELEQYEMAYSWTGDNIRKALVGFNPTEQEFRDIYKHWRAHDEFLAEFYAQDAATRPPDPGNQHVKKAIREALGEERYKQYTRAWWNTDFHELARLARDTGLPAQIPNQVYDLRDAMDTTRNEIRANRALTPQQRQAAMQSLRTEADRLLQQTLGDTAYQAYQAQWGRWLNRLQ